MEMVSIVVDTSLKEKIIEHYLPYRQDNTGIYVEFFASKDDMNITVYSSKKEDVFKVFFSGKGSLVEAHKWDENATPIEIKIKKESKQANWIDLGLQIGSDEVGTGDFFGPVVVVATLVKKEDITFLKSLGVDDSKRLSDDQIKAIAPQLTKRLAVAHIPLSLEKYNTLVSKGYNMNAIKAILHNKVLATLLATHPEVENVYVDQFCEPEKYFSYLENTKQIITKIFFQTKGETYFPSVAAASIIARYSFLTRMEELSKKYEMEFPLGANTKVDRFAKEFVNKYGIDELKKIVKQNFTNYKDIIKSLNEEK